MENTRVSNSPLPIESIVVPVQSIIEQIRGQGATTVTARVTYLDDELRVTRTPDDQLFVYRRV